MSRVGKRWIRVTNGPIAGVCGGLAKALGVDPTLTRIVWFCATFFFGLSILVYLVLWLLLPREDKQFEPDSPVILGVCLRLARRMDWEVSVVRALTLLSPIPTFGTTVLVYLVAWLFLPREATTEQQS